MAVFYSILCTLGTICVLVFFGLLMYKNPDLYATIMTILVIVAGVVGIFYLFYWLFSNA